jgi:hypothetical protein
MEGREEGRRMAEEKMGEGEGGGGEEEEEEEEEEEC